VLAALGALLAALLLGPPPARGIEPQPVEIILAQRPVMLDLYLPTGDAPPHGAVVLAHGFTRTRATMAEHAAALAALGLIAAVPDLPYVTDSRANARVLADLVQWLRAGTQTPAVARVGALGQGPARVGGRPDHRGRQPLRLRSANGPPVPMGLRPGRCRAPAGGACGAAGSGESVAAGRGAGGAA